MILFLLTIQILIFLFSLIEERTLKYNKPVYIVTGIVLILYAGLKEVGFDKDSETYEYYFTHYYDDSMLLSVEYSFRLLSMLGSFIYDDVHVIFLIYAGLAVTIKFYAFRRLSDCVYLPLVVYLGYFFIFHEMTQIRASVVASLVLLMIIPLAEGRKKMAALLLCAAVFFHYSAIALIPMLFLSNKEMGKKARAVWAMVIPLAYAICLAGVSFVFSLSIPYIGDKLQAYQTLRDQGVIGDEINVFNAILLVTIAAYFYCIYFYDTIALRCKYLPLIIKMTGISIFLFVTLSFIPVVAYRVYALYGIANILLFTCIYYTIKPDWLGKCVVGTIGITLFLINVFFTKLLE